MIKGLITLGFNLLTASRGSEHLHAIGIAVLEYLVVRNKLFMCIVLEKLGNQFSQVTELSQYTGEFLKKIILVATLQAFFSLPGFTFFEMNKGLARG